MDVKHREVMLWLREVYGEENIPIFEKTERSVEILYDLMNKNKDVKRDASLLEKDFQRKSMEYDAQAQMINKWITTLGIRPAMLSPESQKILSSIVNLQNSMDLRNPSITNMMLGLNQLETRNSQVFSEIETERRRMINLLSLNQTFAKKLQELQIIHDSSIATSKLQKDELEKGAKKEKFNLAKIEDYNNDLKIFDAKLRHNGFKDEIRHDQLLEKAAEVELLEKEVSENKKRLASYVLPPDMDLAEAKVEEMRQKFKEIIQGLADVYKPS